MMEAAVRKPAPALPRIGVVIPAFGHPRFLMEAIETAATQELDSPTPIIVVDDGCRMDETRRAVQACQGLYGDMVYYMRQANTRLPGARNTGVRFLLKRFPDLKAIYFLDADNRLSPWSLATFERALGDDPATGWAYPDVGFFGLTADEDGMEVCETAPHYSVLRHMAANISEAGSLVRTEVFRAGVFYNESMTSGFEDWDFWLSCLEAGYKGVRAENTGFRYRKRPESMLADARRVVGPLLARMRGQHKALFSPKSVRNHYHTEAPPFAVLLEGEARALLFLDPCGPAKELDRDAWHALVRAKCRNPVEAFFPERIVLMPADIWRQLTQESWCLHDLFWQIHRQDAPVFALEAKGQELALGLHGSAFLALLNSEDRDVSPQASLKLRHINPENMANAQIAALKAALSQWLDVGNAQLWARRQGRRFTGRSAEDILAEIKEDILGLEDGRVLFPVLGDKPWAGIAVPEAMLEREDIRRSVASWIADIQAAGGKSLLLVEQRGVSSLADEILALGRQANSFLAFPCPRPSDTRLQYLAYDVPLYLSAGPKLWLSSVVEVLDLFITVPQSAGFELMGHARHSGARTCVMASHAWRDETDPGRLLAFEHSINILTTDSPAIAAELHGEGMPSAKIAVSDMAALPQPIFPSAEAPLAPLGWRPRDGFVFLATFGRSGSTVLQRVLQSIDGVCFRGENFNLLATLEQAVRHAGVLKHNVRLKGDIGPAGPWHGAVDVDAGAFETAMADSFIHHILKPRLSDRIVGFKEIRYAEMDEEAIVRLLEFMRRAFAPAKFIFNRRDLDAVSKSSWWKDMAEEEVRARLTTALAAFESFAARYPGECIMLDYEAYNARPEGLRPLFEFLNAPFDEQSVADILAEKLSHS